LYLKKELGYPADKASQLLQAWKGTTYLTPLAGAYLADALLGRFWVILIFSAVYLVGLLGLTLVNWIPGIRPVNGAPPPGAATIPLFWAAMYLTAAGAGGIKPCVSSFGADQFDEHSARERAWRASFFNVFYFVINVGSLLATLLVVPIQETKGYALGFGIPTIAFGCAILLFLAGWPIYKIFPPGGSPFARLYRVLRGAWRNRKLPLPADASELYEEEDPASPLVVVPEAEADSGKLVAPSDEERAPTKTRGLFGKKKKKGPKQPPEPAEKMPHTEGMAFLDKAAIRGAHTHGRSGTPISVSVVEESKAFYRIMPIFALVIIYQMTYDPIFTLLPYPGDVMDRKLGSGGAVIPASSISFANTFGGERVC
jgi:peptide/histidine transporter 3/4